MRVLCAIGLSLVLAGAAAAAPCRSSGSDKAAIVLPSGNMQADAPIIVSSSVLLRRVTDDSLRGRPACDRGGFDAGCAHYELTGEDGDHPAPRRAVPKDRAAPVAALIPMIDLEAAIRKSKQQDAPAPRTVMVLVTSVPDALTVWRGYDVIPDDAILTADMQAALAGKLSPVLRSDRKTGKQNIFVNDASLKPPVSRTPDNPAAIPPAPAPH